MFCDRGIPSLLFCKRTQIVMMLSHENHSRSLFVIENYIWQKKKKKKKKKIDGLDSIT